MIDDLVAGIARDIDADLMLADVARIASFDRFQASAGLAAAAAEVAAAASAAGLTEVQERGYPADGAAHWWSFDAPLSWTPVSARLDVTAGGRSILTLDQSRDAFAVATYSAATPGAVEAPVVPLSEGPARGALVLVDRASYARGSLISDLTAAGALGFVTDATARYGPDGGEHRGRIELPLRCPLMAFSVTPREFSTLRQHAGGDARGIVDIRVDDSHAMPVVSAVLPSTDSADEVWLMAHLCHPRPSANDNASGVAALLGAARALRRFRARATHRGPWPTVRFVWAPEFVGTAAVLHDLIGPGGTGHLPVAVVNLDMVGEDQARCAAPFVLERPPDMSPSLLGPVAEHVVGRVFAHTADEPGIWRPAPFQGFSDHALFADPAVARPAVQLCHPADRFNHSAGDTPDMVSPVEMRRSVTVAATLAAVVADGAVPPRELRAITDRWCDTERRTTEDVARRVGGGWAAGLTTYVARHAETVRQLGYAAKPSIRTEPPSVRPEPPSGALHHRWDGPLNLRAMTGRLSPASRAALAELVTQDKFWLSALFHVAVRADGTRTGADMVRETSYELRRPIPDDVGRQLLDALCESGWVAETAA